MGCTKNYRHQNCDVVVGYDMSSLQCGIRSLHENSNHDLFGRPIVACTGDQWEVSKEFSTKISANSLMSHYSEQSRHGSISLYRRSDGRSHFLRVDQLNAVKNIREDQSPCGKNDIKTHRSHLDQNGKRCSGPVLTVTRIETASMCSDEIARRFPRKVEVSQHEFAGGSSVPGHLEIRSNDNGEKIILKSISHKSRCSQGDRIMYHSNHLSVPRCPGPRKIYCDGEP